MLTRETGRPPSRTKGARDGPGHHPEPGRLRHHRRLHPGHDPRRLFAQEIHEDGRGFLPLGPLPARLDHGPGLPLGQPGGPRGHRHGRQLGQVRHRHRPLLLGRGHPGHGLPGHLHDAVLLRQPRPDRARVPQAPLQRGDAGPQRHLVRRHDRPHERHQSLRHGPALQDHARLVPHREHPLRRRRRPPLRLLGRPVLLDLQRGHPVLPHLARPHARRLPRTQAGRRLRRLHGQAPGDPPPLGQVPRHEQQSPGRRLVRGRHGPRLRPVVRLLDDRLPRRPAGPGLEEPRRRPDDPDHRRVPEDARPHLVVIPGLVALLVLPEFGQAALPTADYNSALILL